MSVEVPKIYNLLFMLIFILCINMRMPKITLLENDMSIKEIKENKTSKSQIE